MLSQSRSVLLLGLKRMQEKEEKDSRPRVMMDRSREAGRGTPQNSELLSRTERGTLVEEVFHSQKWLVM